jgi:hypothetical protein
MAVVAMAFRAFVIIALFAPARTMGATGLAGWTGLAAGSGAAVKSR